MDKLDRSSVLYNKILGCLVGGALGDAIGGVSEMMLYPKIEQVFGWIDRPLPTGTGPETARFSQGLPAGSFTDDTRLKHMLCEAIVRKQGRVTADEVAEVWREQLQGWYYTPVLNAFYKLFMGDARPREAGQGGMASNSTAMSISPVGIINAGNPAQAAQDAYEIASMIHEGEARDGAVVIAAAVAEAFKPEATPTSILAAASSSIYPKGRMKERILSAIALAQKYPDYRDFRQVFYQHMLVATPQGFGFSPAPEGFYDTAEPLEAVPAALGLFLLAGGKWRKTVEFCANFGRDADTLATMGGAIAGAFEGAGVIPSEWIDLIPAANPGVPDQFELADHMGSAVLHTVQAMRALCSTLETMS
ncbi:MAG: ADP-ribosylglycohydrolase family protein [Anaerolineaceae bacterium]|nr:ADP-ribosylglycohydrolase family protein [Anaerolineaceae bacterium]